ncbi:MAG: methyltransferase [Paludibacteraceae bacterium]|nr:methyltransferase [Paludibacteraceae bacterium]
MSTPNFRFKQFTVWHDQCAMKVGTDGVLLGAWCPKGTHILDVGTGSGLIALMAAQRFPEASVDAIDIDEAAVEQAQENFAASPWSDRLHAYLSPLQNWSNHQYDLIVSNPPYFQNGLKNPDKARQAARHTDTLSFAELFRHSARLLSENGVLALVLPAETEQEVRGLAAAELFSPTHITRVYSKESKPARRVLMSFTRNSEIPEYRNSDTSLIEDSLVLENEIGGRSAAYQELTKDFYL